MSSIEHSSQMQFQSNTSHSLRSDAEYTNSIARETCLSPKQDTLENLMSNTALHSDVINRFKFCKGKPVCRVSDVDYTRSGSHAKGSCIVCKKRTNWYCILCRNFACHDTTDSSIKYITDANKCKKGNHIAAVKSCFIHCHPNYL